MPPIEELLRTPILGPWSKSAGAVTRRQQVYLSLVHWYEGAKFMPHRPEMRDALLFCPTSKEARKFARTRNGGWRSDWAVTRHSVLIAGLGMLALQRPELALSTRPLADIKQGLAPMELPERFVDACLDRFELWRCAPRISVFGAEHAPTDVVGVKLAKLVAPIPNWTLISPCHRRCAWRVHDWALSHYVPVQYIGTPHDRSSRAMALKLISASDQIVVFEQKRNKRFDHVLQVAKQARKRLALELYEVDGGLASQLRLA